MNEEMLKLEELKVRYSYESQEDLVNDGILVIGKRLSDNLPFTIQIQNSPLQFHKIGVGDVSLKYDTNRTNYNLLTALDLVFSFYIKTEDSI
jgi:hypothetical protein